MENPIPTRYSLLSRLKDRGDDASWRDFYETYRHLIHSFALKSGLAPMEADDVLQETVLSVSKHLESFKKERKLGSFKGWLLNLTRWRIEDQLRKRMKDHARERLHKLAFVDADDVPLNTSSQDLEQLWESEWRANVLAVATDRVKQKVKEEHYQIFHLMMVKKWPAGKVAKFLDVSLARVYLAKHKVSSLMREEIKLVRAKLES